MVKKKYDKGTSDLKNFSNTARAKATNVWNNDLTTMDRGSYKDFNDFLRSGDWASDADKTIINLPRSKLFHLFGTEYVKKSYLKEFIPHCYKSFKVATYGTSLKNIKIKILEKESGKYWNSKSKYPISQNEFINEYFDDDEEKVKGIEGIWNQSGFGLIGIVKEGSHYQKYNIVINEFDNFTPAANFNNNEGSAYLWEFQSDFPPPDDIDLSGTMDGAFIPLGNKRKFKYDGKITLMAKVDDVIAPINIEMKMQATLINKNVMQIRPPYGNEVYRMDRVWPQYLSQDGDDNEISASSGSGTAFFVDSNGHLITNYHVVKDSKNKLKIIYKNKEIEAKVIASDKKLDLALIKTEIKNKSFISTSNKKPEKLQDIISSGYPGGKHLSDDLKFTSGIISSLKGANDNTAHIQTDLALNHGNSGGPIVDKETGQLVAVAVSGLRKDATEGINFGIKSSQVKDFLESNNIKNSKWTFKKAIKRSELLSILENSTVYIFFE